MQENTVEVAMLPIERTVNHFIRVNPYLLKYHTREDLCQELICHFLEKNLLEKYDSDITSFNYFIARAAKNHLIDMTRKRIINCVSLSTLVGEEEGTELVDMIEDETSSDAEVNSLLIELLESVSDDRISPNYNTTWRKLMGWVANGFTPTEIAKKITVRSKNGLVRNLSTGRTSQIISEMRLRYAMD